MMTESQLQTRRNAPPEKMPEKETAASVENLREKEAHGDIDRKSVV
jgi:hypothetical protein